MRALLLLLACFAAFVAACDEERTEPTATPPADGGSDAFVDDTFCPDPEHPAVHYVSDNPNECLSLDLVCDTGQSGFDNSCGCGCIDPGGAGCPVPGDPAITWTSQDPSECPAEPPGCPPDDVGFSNSCGCGCISH